MARITVAKANKKSLPARFGGCGYVVNKNGKKALAATFHLRKDAERAAKSLKKRTNGKV